VSGKSCAGLSRRYAVFDQTFFEKVCDQAFFEKVCDQAFSKKACNLINGKINKKRSYNNCVTFGSKNIQT
jgi:hypothetical protein